MIQQQIYSKIEQKHFNMTYIYHITPNLNFLVWCHLIMAVSCSLFVLYKPVCIFCWFRWCRRFSLDRCLWGLVPRETLCFQTFGDCVQLNVWGSFINSSFRKIQMKDFLRWTLKSRRRSREWFMYIPLIYYHNSNLIRSAGSCQVDRI